MKFLFFALQLIFFVSVRAQEGDPEPSVPATPQCQGYNPVTDPVMLGRIAALEQYKETIQSFFNQLYVAETAEAAVAAVLDSQFSQNPAGYCIAAGRPDLVFNPDGSLKDADTIAANGQGCKAGLVSATAPLFKGLEENNLPLRKDCIGNAMAKMYDSTGQADGVVSCVKYKPKYTNDFLDGIVAQKPDLAPLFQERIVAEGHLGKYSYYILWSNGTLFVTGQQTGDFEIEFRKQRSPLHALYKLSETDPRYKITNIYIDDDMVYIGSGLFYLLRDVETVRIPSSTFYILHNAFYGCIKLKSVELPFLLQAIGMNPFYGCLALEQITIHPIYVEAYSQCIPNVCLSDEQNEAFTATNIINGVNYGQMYCSHSNVLYTRDRKGVYIYPPGVVPENGIYEITEGTKEVGYGAFAWTQLKEVKIPDSVTHIVACAFELSIKLEKLVIPYKVSVLSAAIGLFDVGLNRIDIMGTIIYVGQNILTSCYDLKEIYYHGYSFPSGAQCDPLVYQSWTGDNRTYVSQIFYEDLKRNPAKYTFCGMSCFANSTITPKLTLDDDGLLGFSVRWCVYQKVYVERGVPGTSILDIINGEFSIYDIDLTSDALSVAYNGCLQAIMAQYNIPTDPTAKRDEENTEIKNQPPEVDVTLEQVQKFYKDPILDFDVMPEEIKNYLSVEKRKKYYEEDQWRERIIYPTFTDDGSIENIHLSSNFDFSSMRVKDISSSQQNNDN